MAIFKVPDQINQIIVYFKYVQWIQKVYFVFQKTYLSLKVHLKDKKTNAWTKFLEAAKRHFTSVFFPIHQLLASLTIMVLKCVVYKNVCNSYKICSKYAAKVVTKK